eukprot:767419-Hanusia_phi.AAC.9
MRQNPPHFLELPMVAITNQWPNSFSFSFTSLQCRHFHPLSARLLLVAPQIRSQFDTGVEVDHARRAIKRLLHDARLQSLAQLSWGSVSPGRDVHCLFPSEAHVIYQDVQIRLMQRAKLLSPPQDLFLLIPCQARSSSHRLSSSRTLSLSPHLPSSSPSCTTKAQAGRLTGIASMSVDTNSLKQDVNSQVGCLVIDDQFSSRHLDRVISRHPLSTLSHHHPNGLSFTAVRSAIIIPTGSASQL